MRSFKETYVSCGVPQGGGSMTCADPNPVGSDWLQEHLVGDFVAAWSNPMAQPFDTPADLWWSSEQDAAVKVKALSRWNNYYVAGTRQMMRDFNFDGIYLDGKIVRIGFRPTR